MSHDTHGNKENKTIISFKNSFWLVVIIVGLFIAALNFIQAESGGEEGHGDGAHHEMKAHEPAGEPGGGAPAGHEAADPKPGAEDVHHADTSAKAGH